jgi:S-adenosylmethionine hydrolase
VFAPAAARLAARRPLAGGRVAAGTRFPDWPDDWPAIIHIDGFGNAVTGVRAATRPAAATVVIDGRPLPRVRTFADVGPGEPLCYANSLGLLEVAVNGGRADQRLCLTLGGEIAIKSL